MLPVKNICFLYHGVDIILDVSDQGDLVYVEFLEKINEFLFDFYIELPYLLLFLLGSGLKIRHIVPESLPILFQ